MYHILRFRFKEIKKQDWANDQCILIADCDEEICDYCNKLEENFEENGYEVEFRWNKILKNDIVDIRKNRNIMTKKGNINKAKSRLSERNLFEVNDLNKNEYYEYISNEIEKN